jgi:hypothetical protein
VTVPGLGDVRGLVAQGVSDLLDGHAVAAHGGHSRMASLVGVPVADTGPSGDLAEPPVEAVAGTGKADGPADTCQSMLSLGRGQRAVRGARIDAHPITDVSRVGIDNGDEDANTLSMLLHKPTR